MSQDTASGEAVPLSLTRLNILQEGLEDLRETLREAFVDLGPRVEMRVFRSLRTFLVRYHEAVLAPSVSAETASGIRDVAGCEFLVVHYLQDVLAACLLLLDEDNRDSVSFSTSGVLLEEVVQETAQSNLSEFYVSRAERMYCKRAFFFMCWMAPVPLHAVIHALYPLLDRSTDSPTGNGTATSLNSISSDLLRYFAAKRTFLSHTLNGLVLQRRTGVKALLRAVLLNDGITEDMTVEASLFVIRLLMRQGAVAWVAVPISDTAEGKPLELFSGGAMDATEAASLNPVHVALVRRPLAYCDEQVRLVSEQHVALMVEQTDRAEAGAREGGLSSVSQTEEPSPSFLRRLQRGSKTIPAQTLEERLHSYLAMWLNQMLHLPPREDSRDLFAEAYRRFFAANKYLLTPAFAALSLRRRPGGADEDGEASLASSEALLALRRLRSIAHGCALGASPRALLLVLEAVMPGLLNLTACAAQVQSMESHRGDSLQRLAEQVEGVWRDLFEVNSAFDAMSRNVVLAAVGPESQRGKFEIHINRVEGPRLVYADATRATPSPLLSLGTDTDDAVCWRGLVALLGLPTAPAPADETRNHDSTNVTAPAPFRAALLGSLVEQATQLLFEAGVAEARTGNARPPTEDRITSRMVSVVENAIMTWPATFVFGPEATLDKVLALLRAVCRLSPVCLRWTAEMIPRVVSEATLASELQRYAAARPADRILVLHRLIHEVRGLLSTMEPGHLPPVEASQSPVDPAEVEARMHDGTRVKEALMAAERMLGAQLAAESETTSSEYDAKSSPLGRRLVDGNNGAASTLVNLVAAVSGALDTQSVALLSVAMMKLARGVEDTALTIHPPFSEELYGAATAALAVCMRCMRVSGDSCVVGHAVHCVTWIAMYRLDSTDNSVVAAALVGELTKVQHDGRQVAAARVQRQQQEAAFQARVKVRLLDVLLSLCDYDEGGLTLRNVDDYCHRHGSSLGSLYRVLAAQCQPSEAPVVQVAAVHLVGQYTIHVFPRVPPASVCQFCQEVFRHTPVEMAKAACASALATVTEYLVLEKEGDAIEPTDVAVIKALASAMSTYFPPRSRLTSGNAEGHLQTGDEEDHDAIHAEVVRQTGRRILDTLARADGMGGALNQLIEEV